MVLAKKFPNDSFDPVPLNRLPHSVDTYSQPGARGPVWHMEQSKILPTHPFPLLINQPILPGLDQQHGLGQGLGSHAARVLSSARGLNSQPFPALGPTTIDNGPAVLCLHSGPEAMGAVPFEIAGLKSSLAHDRLPFSLLLRPLVGLPSSFAVLQQLDPCVTRPCGNNPESAKIRPAIKLAILPRAMRHVKRFPEAATVPKNPCQDRTVAGQKPA